MELTNEQQEKLRAVQIEILKKFIEVCEKNDLQYYMLYGSALGAVRHGGFIPWDDDIDVGMPREDYERFLKIAQAQLPQYYFLQHHTTEKKYPISFAKIRDSRTTYVETTCKNIKMNHGIYIDVFPIDGYPKDISSRKTLQRKLFWLRLSVSRYFYLEKASVKYRVLQAIAAIRWPSKAKAIRKLDKLAQKRPFASSEVVRCFGGAWGEREILPKKVFGKGSRWLFEGIEVVLPEDAESYLSCLYGDYVTLPPKEKRVSHHDTTIVDFENPHTKY